MPRVQHRRGTYAALTAVNPTPLAGELYYETDTGRAKIGDGVTPYTSLSYLGTSGSGSLTDGDKGDIVVSAEGGTWTIDSAVLSNFGRTLIDDSTASAARATLQTISDADSRLTDSREWSAATVTQADAEAGTATTRVAWTVQRVWQAVAAWWAASAAKTKLDGIATGATANATDAQLRDRTTHTGVQAISTVDGLQTALDGKASSSHVHSGADITSGTVAYARLPVGSAASTVCAGDDSRLSDARTPTDGTVTTAKIVDSSVTTAKVADGAITTAKLAAGAVATVDIADDAVTYAKIQNVSATDRLLGRSSAGAGDVEEIACTSFGRSLIDDADAAAARTTLGLSRASQAEVTGQQTTGSITSGQASLTVASATGINVGDVVVARGIAPGTTVSGVSGTTITLSANANATLSSAPVSFFRTDRVLTPGSAAGALCRAWVNFAGAGLVLRAAYNVSSIGDGGVGIHTINFVTAMPDTGYCVLTEVGYSGSNPLARKSNIDSAVYTTTGVRIRTGFDYVSYENQAIVNVAVFR